MHYFKGSFVNSPKNGTHSCTGASGDLARKKTYPSLFFLHANKFLPRDVKIIGYARSALTNEQLHDKLRPHLTSDIQAEIDEFLGICTYIQGSYDADEPEGFQSLQQAILAHESTHPACPSGRLFYLALPPTVYPQIAKGLKLYCDEMLTKSPNDSWIRLVVEKPFGRDLYTSEELAHQLDEWYNEENIYRIDHYLGKEMLQSLFVMRFANSLLAPVWNRSSVASVQITFKEDFGTEGRGGYFDHYGIIRDMIATHLTQILAFVAMEKPNSIHPDDIRDEKLKVLRCIRPADPQNCVLGQYTAGKGNPGYLDDPTVPPGSNTPTFASIVLYVDNDRWAGVPFVIRAGKALNERKADIRLQLHPTPHFIFPGDADDMRNEVVIRLQPDEAIYCKLLVKTPGLEMGTKLSELELGMYHVLTRYEQLYIYIYI